MRKYLYWLLPLGWMGVIFYSSAQPYEKQNIKPFLADAIDLSFLIPYLEWITFTYNHSEVSVSALGILGFVEFFVRKGAHFIVFFVLLLLFYIAFQKTTVIKNGIIIVVSFILTVAYAGIDEYHQGFTTNRTPFIGDVVIDSFGAFVASIILFFISKKVKK